MIVQSSLLEDRGVADKRVSKTPQGRFFGQTWPREALESTPAAVQLDLRRSSARNPMLKAIPRPLRNQETCTIRAGCKQAERLHEFLWRSLVVLRCSMVFVGLCAGFRVCVSVGGGPCVQNRYCASQEGCEYNGLGLPMRVPSKAARSSWEGHATCS